jgi:hypothetical protein
MHVSPSGNNAGATQPPDDCTGRELAGGAAWAAAAENLAAWALARLVNRRDCWGGYRPPEEWGRRYTRADGTEGVLGQQTTHKGRLTDAVLRRHFRAVGRADIKGSHSTSTANTSLWGALDLDAHGPAGTSPAANLAAALAWYARLVGMGFRPLLTTSDGAGGYHLRILLAEAAPTPRVYQLLRVLTSNHAALGLPARPETFPKQPVVRPRSDGSPGYGNWLRLPGRHHSREHWSRVWDGGRWLEGAAAVAFILGLTGDSQSLLPEAPAPQVPRPRTARAPAATPDLCRSVPRAAAGNLSARIAAYLRRLPNLGEGQGRDDIAYRFSCFLVRDLSLPDATAMGWLERWDAGNSPPKGAARLAEILADAHRYGRRTYGCGRPATPRRDRHGHVILTSSREVR